MSTAGDTIRAAFLPLTDSAVLVAARECGFAAEMGIDLQLVRTESWATLRDRLVYGQVQAAQMLAPLAVAVTLGLGGVPTPLAAPFKLNVNGNAVVMRPDFAAALDPDIAARLNDPLATAHDFATAIGLYRRKPQIGIVHRFSSHALMLRYWLASAGIDPDRDVALRVLPPSLMLEAMRGGEIDGFTAGDPWPAAAIAEGLAEAVALGARIWQRGVEKVLAFRSDWLDDHREVADRLLLALARAAAWCDAPENRTQLASLLGRSDYVDMPAALIERLLSGQFTPRIGAPPLPVEDLILFHREAANFPWRSQALWIWSQLVRWGQAVPGAEAQAAAGAVFRPDIYRRALAGSGAVMPGASAKLEGAVAMPTGVGAHGGALLLGPDRFFDGRVFDPEAIDTYLAGF
ncbi:CmpA/NrtA family ABC transporter substrate-binding protein [Croceibacterium ferulae]|uniref:CmpA/NrtA family ABC transporter substrate-binding protein n=1 Tax=Croceibacterium ferulae TaxID=1854641 RepID=UPI000EACCF1F|nr:CmpA/NrtA family ABC transporter substrate-binding protein [Croceibacterium ferulae]